MPECFLSGGHTSCSKKNAKDSFNGNSSLHNLNNRLSNPPFALVNKSTRFPNLLDILQWHSGSNYRNHFALLNVIAQSLQIFTIRLKEKVLIFDTPPSRPSSSNEVGNIETDASEPGQLWSIWSPHQGRILEDIA